MVAISPLLNILSKSIRTVRKFVLRDFYEIEKLQSSIKKNNHFIDNSVSKLKNEVEKILEQYQAQRIIHGHTHRPAVHSHPFGLRCVTSDWGMSGTGVLVDTRDDVINVSLCRMSLDNITVTEQWSRHAGTPEWKRNSSSVVSISN